MDPRAVIDHFGSLPKAAAALGVSRAAIYQWLEAGLVPELRAYQIQVITDGALQADRSRYASTEQPAETSV